MTVSLIFFFFWFLTAFFSSDLKENCIKQLIIKRAMETMYRYIMCMNIKAQREGMQLYWNRFCTLEI